MCESLEDVTFEEWITHVFDHEVLENQWYWSIDSDEWCGSSELTLEYLTQLFKNPHKYLDCFSDEQREQGFQYIISCGSDMMFSIRDEDASFTSRLNCLRAFLPLFKNMYAVRCSKHLSHCDQNGANPLNSSCYMWWDVIPICPDGSDDTVKRFEDECISIMSQILGLNSIACQESALHGLGHWAYAYAYPKRVSSIINSYIKKSKRLPIELKKYAENAKVGRIQ